MKYILKNIKEIPKRILMFLVLGIIFINYLYISNNVQIFEFDNCIRRAWFLFIPIYFALRMLFYKKEKENHFENTIKDILIYIVGLLIGTIEFFAISATIWFIKIVVTVINV